MSDSDNYFSDSDKSEGVIEKTLSDLENSEELSEYEMDEETRKIIYDSLLNKPKNNDYSYFSSEKVPSKKKRVRKPRNQKKVGLTLESFQEKIESDKPKKWKSKRSQDKKNELGITEKKVIMKRQFNPRLPPPTYKTFKKKDEEEELVNSEEAFPSLSDTFKNLDV